MRNRNDDEVPRQLFWSCVEILTLKKWRYQFSYTRFSHRICTRKRLLLLTHDLHTVIRLRRFLVVLAVISRVKDFDVAYNDSLSSKTHMMQRSPRLATC